MGIVKNTELATVSASQKFGEPPTYSRQWVVEVDNPTTTESDILRAVPVKSLDSHPDFNWAKAFTASIENYNGSRWHFLVKWDYEVPKQKDLDPNPLARPDIWKFASSGMAVPALWYYAGSGNNDQRALTNSAGDFFEGVTTDMSVLKAHISGNRQTFNYGLAASITNAINDAPYCGGAQYTWRCDGISGQPAVEIVNEAEIRYWQVEVELTYRPDGHPLLIPNVGWNYASGNERRRVWVWNESKTEKLPASNPQPLNSDGTLDTAGPGDSNPPLLLTRRTQKAVNFATYFGTPPAT
jgi:hypothetical protein